MKIEQVRDLKRLLETIDQRITSQDKTLVLSKSWLRQSDLLELIESVKKFEKNHDEIIDSISEIRRVVHNETNREENNETIIYSRLLEYFGSL